MPIKKHTRLFHCIPLLGKLYLRALRFNESIALGSNYFDCSQISQPLLQVLHNGFLVPGKLHALRFALILIFIHGVVVLI